MQKYKLILETAAVIVAVVVLVVYFFQLRVMQQQVKLAERAWVGFVLPGKFPLDAASIPATIQVTSFGKTPARKVVGHIVATVLKKGQEPIFDYSIGHAYNNFYTGVIFPSDPLPVTIPVMRYTDFPPGQILSAPEVSKELATGDSYIVFFGEIQYTDIFGKNHWTHFCTGTGKAMMESLNTLKKCTTYNDVGDY